MSKYGYADNEQKHRIARQLAKLCNEKQCPMAGVSCPFYRRSACGRVYEVDWCDFLFGEEKKAQYTQGGWYGLPKP